MAAARGGLDALVFTAGVGEHAAPVRAAVCAGLGWMGIAADAAANAEAVPDAEITAPGGAVRVLVIHTREDLVVARETRRILALR
jgi:acetate kinase